jgi:hypothetical protein
MLNGGSGDMPDDDLAKGATSGPLKEDVRNRSEEGSSARTIETKGCAKEMASGKDAGKCDERILHKSATHAS